MNTTSRSKLYNVLWIDDEWDKMTVFKQECEEIHGLHLVPFKVRKLGMEALEQDMDKWQAVLLDAKMWDETENEVAKLTGLRKAKQRLDELSMKRAIPYFVSTGQPDLLDNETFNEFVGKFYTKGLDDEQLIEDMLSAIENSEPIQIQAAYSDVFAALDAMKIRRYSENILLDILLPMHYPAKYTEFKPVYQYNQLRQLLEYIFRACNNVGIVPDKCISDGKVNLNQCSLYLAGKNAEKIGLRFGEIGERVIPEYIESIIRSVLEFGNIHSHTVDLNEEDAKIVDSILKSAQSKYLIFGLALQLCEVVTWFSSYISHHNDKEINEFLCKDIPINSKSEYEGKDFVIEQDEKNNYHCGQCRLSFKAAQDYKGKLVTLYDVTENNAKSKDNYPFFAKFRIK